MSSSSRIPESFWLRLAGACALGALLVTLGTRPDPVRADEASPGRSECPATRTLPPGHPPVDGALPPGHPPVEGRSALPEGHPPVQGARPELPPGHPPIDGLSERVAFPKETAVAI